MTKNEEKEQRAESKQRRRRDKNGERRKVADGEMTCSEVVMGTFII